MAVSASERKRSAWRPAGGHLRSHRQRIARGRSRGVRRVVYLHRRACAGGRTRRPVRLPHPARRWDARRFGPPRSHMQKPRQYEDEEKWSAVEAIRDLGHLHPSRSLSQRAATPTRHASPRQTPGRQPSPSAHPNDAQSSRGSNEFSLNTPLIRSGMVQEWISHPHPVWM